MKYFTLFISVLLTILSFGQSKLKIDFQDCRSLKSNTKIVHFRVFKDDSIFRSIQVLNEKDLTLSKIPNGIYKIEYVSIFGTSEYETIEINKKGKYSLIACVNKLDTSEIGLTPFVRQINERDTMVIKLHSTGCFHNHFDSLLIYRKDSSLLFAQYNGIEMELSEDDIKLIEEFEFELPYNNGGGCTTVDSYEIEFKTQSIYAFDGSCNWYGFDYLLKSLNLKSENNSSN